MSTAVEMPQATSRRAAAAAVEMPQAADEMPQAAADDEIKPWLAYVVECPVILIYRVVCLLWPTWIWEQSGTRDKELAAMDLDAYWNDIFGDAADELAYPLVRVPSDLEGIDRIVWRLSSYDWWVVKAWGTVVAVKRFYYFGFGLEPPLRLDPFNEHALRG